ncbi:MAG TPA: hypothetical protein VK647_02120 [Gemmatimonadales bacterium]|nr:hypothetical protein [Gemmatimonadales bacterium]
MSRRPQCGQNGWSPLARPPQKGQEIGSPWSRARAERATTRVAGAAPAAVTAPPSPPLPADAAAGVRPVDLPMGLPQSMQNCAPGSFARPQ